MYPSIFSIQKERKKKN